MPSVRACLLATLVAGCSTQLGIGDPLPAGGTDGGTQAAAGATDGGVVGPAADLASLASGGGCWFANLNRAAVTAGAIHWLVTAAHTWCGAQSDPVIAWSSRDAVAWQSETVFTNTYAGPSGREVWAAGIPNRVSATADAEANVHAVFENRAQTSYWSPGHLFYAFRRSGAWSVVGDVVDDEALQAAAGNPGGAQYSGINDFTVAYAANKLLLFGYDSAWWATRYNVAAAMAAPFGAWSPLAAVFGEDTRTVDRGAIQATDQDFDAAAGVQAWIDKPNCKLLGRELEGGAFGVVSVVEALEYPRCQSDANASYGFVGDLQVLVHDGVFDLFAILSAPDGSDNTLIWLHRKDGAWQRRVVDWTGVGVAKAFLAPRGTVGIAAFHRGRSQLEVYLPELDAWDPVREQSANVVQLDLARHSPKFIAWVEEDSVGQHLRAAAFHSEAF